MLKPLFLLCCCTCLLPAAPAHALSTPLVYTLSEKDGLTDNTVNCFFRDSRNIMWMGTAYGLNSYDGSVILNYHAGAANNTLAGEDIHDIKEDDAHTLWIATNAGLSSFDLQTKTFHTYRADSNNNPALNRYFSLAIAGPFIYLATEQGLMEFDRRLHQFRLHTINTVPAQTRSGNHLKKVFVDSRGQIWLGTYYGLWLYDPRHDRSTSYDNPSNDPYFDRLVTTIFEDHSHQLWFGTWNGGLKRLDPVGNKISNFISFKDANSNITTITEQEEDGRYRLRVGHGISELDTMQKAFVALPVKDRNGKIISSSDCLYCDKDNLLWIATEEGIKIYNPNKQYFRNTAFPGGKPITSQGTCLIVLPGRFVVGGEANQSLLEFDNNGVFSANLSSRLNSSAAVLAIAGNKQGGYWLCTTSGIQLLNPEWRKYRQFVHKENDNSSLPVNFINSILFLKNGKIWAFPWRKGIWESGADGKFGRVIGPGTDILLRDANISRAAEDRLGNIWMTDYESGLFQYKPAEKKLRLVFGNCRLTNICIADDTAWSVSEDRIIAADIHGNGVRVWQLPAGKNKYEFDFIVEEKHLWIATRTGLLVFDRLTQQFQSFTQEDGLHSDIMDGNLARLSDGNLVFAGNEYLTIFSPSIADHKASPASLSFTGAYAGGEEKPLAGNCIDISYSEKNIGFHWALQHYSNPLNNQYYYKLDGVDKEWQPAGRQGQVNYNSLAPGVYTFHYMAATSDGILSGERSILLRIHPPFWKTAWFILISSLSLIFLFYSIVKYISQRNLKEQLLRMEKEQAIENERHRISRDIHDDLGSGLTKIAIMSEVVKQQLGEASGAKQQLENISESSRDLVDNLQDIIWVLNRQNDTLEILASYIREAGLKFFEPIGVNIQFNYPETFEQRRLPEDLRRNIFLAIKETFHNIGKHACCSNVEITLQQNAGKIIVEITDDGKGFDPRQVRVFANGLKNIRSRIEQLNGHYSISSAPQQGTVTRIEVAG